MAYNTIAILVDVNGKPIPQYYDVVTDAFLPMSKDVVLAGSNLKWTPLSIINSSVGVYKVITVPAGKEYRIKHIFYTFTTTATVGNRYPVIKIDTGTSENIVDTQYLPIIAANLIKRASFGQSYPKETAYDAINNIILRPLFDVTLQTGNRIIFSDDSAVDINNDTIKYYVHVLQRSV